MLTNTKEIKGLEIRATDGRLGTVDQFYFDDDTWMIRYLTVETGGWLGGRQVLISPFSVIDTNWRVGGLVVSLTKQQVEGSPDIDTDRPVSRQHEAAYLGYFGYWTPCITGLAVASVFRQCFKAGDHVEQFLVDGFLPNTV